MEDDDFGFTKRDKRALVKVLSVEKDGEQTGEEEGEGKEGKEGEPSSAPTRAAVAGGSGGKRNVLDRTKTAPSSVPNNKPNIPNVVEYHLKVKPSSKSSKHEDKTRNNNRTEEMKKDLTSSMEKKKDLITKLSRLSIDNNVFEGSTDLPQVFQVKYLGSHDARGLWGIKNTRQPVNNMVASAKALPPDMMLPLIKLVVSQEGVALLPLDKRKQETNYSPRMYAIENISYGVQDLVYTRVFSMIVVRETDNLRKMKPFECHGFVCESKHHARQLTYALATAFEIYSKNVKIQDKVHSDNVLSNTKKRFAIDLRSPEEIEADLCMDSEA